MQTRRNQRFPRLTGSGAVLIGLALVACGGSCSSPAAEPRTPLQQAAALRAAGRLDAALEILRAESRKLKQQEGEASRAPSPALLDINQLAADILIEQGSLETADSLLAKTLASRQELVAAGRREQPAELARGLLVLARLRLAQKRFPDAVDAARRALTLGDQAAGPRSPDVARAREALAAAVAALDTLLGPADAATLAARDDAAKTLESVGMFAAAVEQRRGIVDGLAARGGPADDALTAARERLCRLMMIAGLGDEALAMLDESAAADAGTPAALANLRLRGDLELATDRLIAAGSSCEVVLRATAAAGSPAVMAAADRMRALAVAARRGKAATLPDWFGPALATLAKPPATEAPTAIAALVVAADVLVAMGQQAPALDALTKALAITGTLRPPSPEQVADVSGRMGAAQLATGDAAGARKTVEPALAAAEKALGPGDPRVGFLRVLLAGILARGGDDKRAIALAATALDRDLPRPDRNWEEMVTAIYDRMPPVESGEGWPERFVAARARQFGDDHPHVGTAWSLFGAARLAAGDWAKAAECFSRAVAALEARLGDEHPEVAATRTLLAHAERAAGNPSRAAATAARAMTGWERAAGPGHPGTLGAIDVLVDARLQAGETEGVVPLLERLCAAEPPPDPVLRAGHLVRLAGLTVDRDKAGAEAAVRKALKLPCWQPAAGASAVTRQRLAVTAARAAHVFTLLGDADASQQAVRRARSLAVQTKNPAALLERIERIAADGDGPPPAP